MPHHQKSVRIVFIEDYQLIRAGIPSFLNNIENFNVVSQADNAESGLRAVEQYQPELVLMDVKLPGINGIEATRLIKAKTPDIKVIMLTSCEDEESVIASLAAGANAYCLNGIALDRLVEVIDSVMDGASWLDPDIAKIALSVFSERAMRSDELKNPQISLGDREREVLRLLTLGKNNTEIAAQLYVSVHTVKSQVSTILQKMAVSHRVQAAVKAVTSGIFTQDELLQ